MGPRAQDPWTMGPWAHRLMDSWAHGRMDPRALKRAGFARMHLQMEVNGRLVHPTHNMHSLKGLFACTKCGAMGTKKLNLLFIECKGKLTGHSKRNLNLLSAGLLPKGCGNVWPMDDPITHVQDQLEQWQDRLVVQDVQRQVQALAAADQASRSSC